MAWRQRWIRFKKKAEKKVVRALAILNKYINTLDAKTEGRVNLPAVQAAMADGTITRSAKAQRYCLW